MGAPRPLRRRPRPALGERHLRADPRRHRPPRRLGDDHDRHPRPQARGGHPQGRRPQQGRLPRHPRARAAQSARADPQRRDDPRPQGAARLGARLEPRRDRAPGGADVAPDRGPARHRAHLARQVRHPQGARRARARDRHGARDEPALHHLRRPPPVGADAERAGDARRGPGAARAGVFQLAEQRGEVHGGAGRDQPDRPDRGGHGGGLGRGQRHRLRRRDGLSALQALHADRDHEGSLARRARHRAFARAGNREPARRPCRSAQRRPGPGRRLHGAPAALRLIGRGSGAAEAARTGGAALPGPAHPDRGRQQGRRRLAAARPFALRLRGARGLRGPQRAAAGRVVRSRDRDPGHRHAGRERL